MTDIPAEQHQEASEIGVGGVLGIELVEGDPAFFFEATMIGWLAVNIEEVSECLQAGWHYQGEVRSNEESPAGPIILTLVTCRAPGK